MGKRGSNKSRVTAQKVAEDRAPHAMQQKSSPVTSPNNDSTHNVILVCMVLIVLTAAIYLQVGNHQFVSFDDDIYVTNNIHVANGLSGANILWAITSVDVYNWHPITWLSHMTDVQFYGMNPRGHHLTNVFFHTISALLLLFLLFRSTGAIWQSSFVAFLFALHPLHVESVAWVAERKDVLSGLFSFLTLLIYAEYSEKRKLSLYLLALCAFMLGLMSKPMLVTLPIVMLLMDFWPLGRYRHEEQEQTLRQISNRATALIKEKIPFFVCSLFPVVFTLYGHQKLGAMYGLDEIPLDLRIENSLVAYVRYIGKTIWPHDLAIYYPFPLSIPLWQVISSLSILLFVSVAVIRAGRRYSYLAVGWFWFLITLVPVIGLIQFGAHSAMADRFTYIPLTGLFIMTAWGVPDVTKRLPHRENILALLAVTVIIASSLLTWQQLGYWRDSISLYRHAVQVVSNSDLLHVGLGDALANNGDQDAALEEYQKAIRINPNNGNAHNNIGAVFASKGDLDAAIREYREALRINPSDTRAHTNLGNALAGKGDLDAAIRKYHESLRINPNDTMAHYNLGHALAGKGDLDAAIQEYREALRINPYNAHARKNLGLALDRKRGQADADK